jgi:predicted outer membrane protein
MRASAVLAALVAAACSDGSGGITAPADRSAQLAVVPGILIGADSNPVTVARGASATVNVRVTRVSGFTGPITLAVDTAGVARGVRATVANATVAAGDTAARAVTITVDTTATASATPTTFRITASGSGVTTQTLLMQVVVANPAQGFTLAFAGASNASLQTGGTGTVRVVVRRTGGFTGPLTFTADAAGLPAGVTVTQGATSGDTVTLNLAAGATTTPGNYTITLRGAGTGVTAQTLSLPLSVQQAGNFSIGGAGAGPITVTGAAGTTVTVPVRIGRGTGFGGRVTLAASGAPTGVTAVFDSAVTTGGTTDSVANLRLTLPATLAPGTYDITVTGAATGLANQTATVRLTVTSALTGGFGFGTITQRPVVLAGLTNVINLPIQRASGTTGTGAITFTSGPTPPGLTVTSAPTSATGTSTVLTITANADVPAGIYPVTLTGAGPGGSQTTTLNVEVVRDNPSFGFRFVAPSATPTLTAGGTTAFTATLERIATLVPDAFLNVTNVTRGLNVRLVRSQQAEGPIEIVVTADPTALPGTYQFTLTGATTRGTIPPLVIPVRVTAAPVVNPTIASDANIAALLSESNRGEIAAGTIALDRATTAEARNFAQMMIDMHTAVEAQQQTLVRTLGVTPALPDSSLPRAQNAELATLQATPASLQFDRTYLAQQIVAHRRSLALVDASITAAQRAELRTFVQTVVRPAVAAHLQQAIDIQTRLGGPIP